MKDKLIITDADGVLLDWEFAFNRWMNGLGYTEIRTDTYSMAKRYDMDSKKILDLIETFNSSSHMERIPPMRDSIKYVRKMYEELGAVFHVITAFSDDAEAIRLRMRNLEMLYGIGPIWKLTSIGINQSKSDTLSEYRNSGCIWIEDRIEYAIEGRDLGLDSILVAHQHNTKEKYPNLHVVNNWKEIYHYHLDRNVEYK